MTSHRDCTHPATKAGRALCRKITEQIAKNNELITTSRREALVRSYYDNTGDAEEIIAGLHAIDPELTEAYYHGDATIEEIIASAR
jgi:hypothetical protein